MLGKKIFSAASFLVSKNVISLKFLTKSRSTFVPLHLPGNDSIDCFRCSRGNLVLDKYDQVPKILPNVDKIS